MKTFPVFRAFDYSRQIGTITLEDDVVIMGNECFAFEAEVKSETEATLKSISLTNSEGVKSFTGKAYGIDAKLLRIILE